MKIKELSNLLNVSQKTIRYYEDCGFIMPLTQNKSGRIFRDYDEAAITQLKTIIGLRKLRFSIDEIKALYEMTENKNTTEECLVGAYLLLEQQPAAEIHFKKLSEKEQKCFKEYPIYYYWKTEENTNG